MPAWQIPVLKKPPKWQTLAFMNKNVLKTREIKNFQFHFAKNDTGINHQVKLTFLPSFLYYCHFPTPHAQYSKCNINC